MAQKTGRFALLSFLSAALLSAGFLFPHCGGAALIGFVPLLWMDRLATKQGMRHFWWWHYLAFVLWNAFTTFWVCNATVGGGIAAILINALEMSVIWAIFRLSKKRFTGTLPYIFLASAWIAWERAYFSAEVSWPWLTLGNAFATTTSCAQWYDVTGTLGGSLWVWLCNLSVFGILCTLTEGGWQKWNSRAKITAVALTAAVFILPPLASFIRGASYREDASCGSFTACVLQPNLDPYQKFELYTQVQQDEILCSLMNDEGDSSILYVAPETVTGGMDADAPAASQSLQRYTEAAGEGSSVLFGASTYSFIRSSDAPSYTARPFGSGVWYESHNSAVMASGSFSPEIYHKSRLVVGTEKMPWPRLFNKVDEWLGGGIIARCVGQDKVSLLHYDGMYDNTGKTSPVNIGCAVCYESVYPEYFASYVAAGARAMAVITNDAWWGNTPGYRQHCNYSRLRAIETRRDIIRSANTGISCFINQRGEVLSSLDWDKRGHLSGTVNCSDSLTPFVRYGDVTGRICTFLFIILALALVVALVQKNR